MGNVALCAPSLTTSNSAVKVLSSEGKLIIYTKATVKAGEIMVENPGQFVCQSSQLVVGQRIVGVNAEEELERGELYFLLPMEILYSVLTNEEMNCIRSCHKVSKGMINKQSAGSHIKLSKIFPDYFCLVLSNNNSESRRAVDVGSDADDDDECELNVRLSRQRYWQPALETIVETPPRTTTTT